MDMILSTIEGAQLSITTNEPQQNKVVSARVDATQATPGPDFELTVWDDLGVPHVFTFVAGTDTTKNIPGAQQSQFLLVNKQRPDGTFSLQLSKPEFLFHRLNA